MLQSSHSHSHSPSPQVGPTEHAICALSGGVDSTVAATLVHRVLGERLHCVFVDHGLLRYKVSGWGFVACYWWVGLGWFVQRQGRARELLVSAGLGAGAGQDYAAAAAVA